MKGIPPSLWIALFAFTSNCHGATLPQPNTRSSNKSGTPFRLPSTDFTATVPFIGIPFAVTGCIEAEQFDLGGQGVAYNSLGGNTVTNDYRPSMMQIVTNTTDFPGAGFIVDILRSNEWLKYTLDVRVGQYYAVEARVAGIGTGGVFHIEFTNAATGAFTNTGPLTVLSTNWTNLARTLLPLSAGTNMMKVVMDTNSSANAVCQLNYISIYPSWGEGVPNLVANTNVTGLTNNDPSWAAATNNAARIRDALNFVNTLNPTNGGSITFPEGTYFVAQPFVDEALDAENNSACLIARSNVEIRGAGKTNTTLITHNRATTIFYVGRSSTSNLTTAAVTNFTLRDLTIEGRPHVVATNAGTNGFITFIETGALDTRDVALGNLVVFGGVDGPSAKPSVNLLFTNCLFRNPSADCLWSQVSCIFNVAVRNCDFVFRDGTNGAFEFPPYTIVNPNIPTTSSDRPGASGVGFFVRVCDTFAQNLVMLDCTFNGNPALTNLSPNNTNFDAGDGIFWSQAAANCFVGRCALTNYGLEGVQFGQGPAAVVASDFRTFVSRYATVALLAIGRMHTLTGSTNDNTYYAVANRVAGGRFGYLEVHFQDADTPHSQPNFTGNYIELTPPYDAQVPTPDHIGAAFEGAKVEYANIAGNKLVAGGHGARWQTDAISGLVLKNDFTAASLRALAYTGTNANLGPAFRFTILRNALGQGAQFHLKGPVTDPGIFFSSENTFKDGAATVNPFIDPLSAPVHTRHKP